MSGRLVILPHKSWNVWNQDNREKVLRDERKHREEEEAKVAKEKQLLQEQNLELLRSGAEVSRLATYTAEEVVVAPFRLFEDLERKHFDQLGNAEYLKEKAAKELAQKKRDGVADWALGEGSYENSKTKPWYATRDIRSGDSPSSSTKNPALDREMRRKETADPMGAILVPNKLEYLPKEAVPPVLPECPPVECIESKQDDASTEAGSDSDGSSKHHRKHKKRKRDKAERKEHERKSKKHHKEGKDGDNSGKRVKSERSGTSAAQAVDPWAELRQKRLEREAVERKRAAILLAERDIYGPAAGRGRGSGGGGGTAGYSQQYNPHLARNNRW